MKSCINKTSTMIGNIYPFFLNNTNMNSYYLYQISSPKMTEDQIPLLTLNKISEKTNKGDFCVSEKNLLMNNGDIISTLMRSRKKYLDKSLNFLIKDVLNIKDEDYTSIYSNGYDFPLFELENNNNLTKSIVVGLRDSLRWSHYRFQSDSYVDILLTKSQFGLFKLEGTSEFISLKPVGLFNMDDLNFDNPISVDWNKIDYPKNKFSGIRKASDLNKAIRITECKSFSINEF